MRVGCCGYCVGFGGLFCRGYAGLFGLGALVGRFPPRTTQAAGPCVDLASGGFFKLFIVQGGLAFVVLLERHEFH